MTTIIEWAMRACGFATVLAFVAWSTWWLVERALRFARLHWDFVLWVAERRAGRRAGAFHTLRAENRRLRARLEDIADLSDDIVAEKEWCVTDPRDRLDRAGSLAAKALADE
jgi:hypothetical protein